MTEIRRFNKNKSCIEMRNKTFDLATKSKFNKNKSCIEINLSLKEIDKYKV